MRSSWKKTCLWIAVFFTFGQTMFRLFGCILYIQLDLFFYIHIIFTIIKNILIVIPMTLPYSVTYESQFFNVNFGQKKMASMIQAIQASKSSESSLASLRTFLVLIEINMLGTNLETGNHIYPWLWSTQCRWFLTPKHVQNHQIHQKKTVLQKRLLVQRWHPCASLRPNLTFLPRNKISHVKFRGIPHFGHLKLFCLPLHHVYPCWKNEDGHGDVSRNGSWHLNPTRGLLNLNNRYERGRKNQTVVKIGR